MTVHNEEFLVVRGLRVVFSKQVVIPRLDLDLKRGSLSALVGPSGCGKTTVLRAIAGLQRPDSGSIRYLGKELNPQEGPVVPEERGIGLVFQDGAVFPHLNVRENLCFGLQGRPQEQQNQRAEDLADLLELSDLLHRLPHQLSGGQLQRVALGRALAPEPQLVLLDEPFANLDAVLRQDLRAELFSTLRGLGTTVLLVTHDRDEAALAEHVSLLRGGQSMQEGSPEDLRRRPQDRFVAGFFGGSRLLKGQRSGSEFKVGTWSLPVEGPAADGPALAVVLPDGMELANPEESEHEALLCSMHLRGGVQLAEVEVLGNEGQGSDAANSVRLWALAGSAPDLTVGSRVGLRLRHAPFYCIPDEAEEA